MVKKNSLTRLSWHLIFIIMLTTVAFIFLHRSLNLKSEDFNLKCTFYSYLFHACSGVIVQEIVIFIVNISITKHLFLMIRVNTNIANK